MVASDPPSGDLRSRVQQQEVVAELGQQALEDGDLDRLLAEATVAVGEALNADYCEALELLPDGEAILLREGVGWQDGLVGSATVPTDRCSRAGYTIHSEEPVVVADLETEERFSGPELLHDHDVTSGISVVVGSLEDPWGVLGVHTTDRREFTDHDVAFVTNVANVLGSAIENGQTRRRLEEEERLKDRIVETSPVGITLIDADGKYVFANDRAEEILDRPLDELREYVHDDDRWNLVDAHGEPLSVGELPFSRVRETGEPVFDEVIGIDHCDGTRVWLSAHCAPLYDDDGAFDGAVYALEDITERRRLESELETTFSRISDAFFGLDTNWEFTYVNEHAEALIDPEGTGLVGENVWEAFPAAVDSPFEREYRAAMASQEPVSFEEYFPPLETWSEVHAYPSETGLSVYFRDVTERKGIERELRKTNHTLERLYEITADRDRSFDEKVDRLLELGRDRLGVDTGFLSTIDVDDDRFEITHASGESERIYPGAVTPLSDTYCRRTIESNGVVGFVDSPTEHGIDERNYEEWGLDCYLGGAVHVDGELYGTLCFEDESSRSTPFTPAETSFVELVTQWVSYELERRRRQRELEESERRYRTLVEHFPNGIVALYNEEFEYTLVGGRLLEEVDTAAEELVGRTIWEHYEGWNLDAVESNYRAALEGERRSFELERRDRDWLFHAVPVRDDDGDVFAGMVMAQDVTERKERERELREREIRLERYKQYTDEVLDAIDDVFYVLDEHGNLQRWNETLCDVTGYPPDAVESMHALDFFAAEDQDVIANAVAEAFEAGHTRVEAPVLTSDGESIPYEFAASTLEDPDGNSVLAGLGRDVTDRKESQRRLEELVADLEESNERLEQFAYAASHDLQEPLRMVSSYLQLVDQRYADELDADGEEFIEFAVDGAQRMQEMINGLLAYSRVDTRGDPFEVVDTEAVVEDVLTDLEVRIEETDAEITVGSLPPIYGDPGQLRQLFQNLLDNAITYSGKKAPHISVMATKDGQERVISVRDRGIGIDPDDADRIFQVFDRLHSIDEYSGTGIGLALCQRIVERHDGDIWVDSEPGEGATFSVALPSPSKIGTDTTMATQTETNE